jgi:hypothetical protein
MQAAREFHIIFGNDAQARVLNIIQLGRKPMRRDSVLLSREKAAHRTQILASIGRGLREVYDTAHPLPDRISDLVRQIAQPTEESGVDVS